MIERNAIASRLVDDFSDVIESVAIPIVVFDRDLRIRRFTAAAADLLGFVGTDVGRPMREIRTKLLGAELTDMSERILSRGAPEEATVQAENGHWYRLTIRPCVTTNQRIDGAVVSVFDVDSFKSAEKILTEAREHAEGIARTARRSEEALRGMLTGAADGILMRNEAGTVVFANLAISNMLGYSIGEMVGMHVDDLYANPSGPMRDRGRDARSPTSNAHTTGLDRDRIAIHCDGRQIPVEVVLTPMDAAEGALTVAFVTNVTVRHEAEKKLLDYQEKLQRMAFDATLADERARRRFAVDVHDRIGQSLAAARLKMVSAREQSHGEVRGAIQQAIDLVGQTIADTRALMFDLSPPIRYDLGFREALDWLADESEKQHGLHVDITELTPPPDLDETTAAILFRSVRELLRNVVKHSQVRQATVSLRTDGDVYEIEVMDRGVGFEVDMAARPGGTGFGLFSIREQMSRLRGTIKVVSTPAEGCSVLLRVPPARVTAPEHRQEGAG